MGLFDIIRGQRKPKRANLDRLFALSTSEMTLTIGLGLAPTGRAGLCFKQVEAGIFEEIMRDLDELLALSREEIGTEVSRHQDSYGFSWVILSDPQLEDLVTTAHLVSQTLEEHGFSEQMLCAVFGFQAEEGPVDLIYAYKRGTFYPFAPRSDKRRDNALELRLQGALQAEMPIEPELERWYPVWDAPVEGEPARGD